MSETVSENPDVQWLIKKLVIANQENEALKRRLRGHMKGEGCKHFCQNCGKPIWFIDDERMECPYCGEHGFHVPDIDAEVVYQKGE